MGELTALPVSPMSHDRLVIGGGFLNDIPAPVWSVRPVFQSAQLVSLTAPTNHGKSAFNMMLAVGIVTGRSIGPFKFQRGKVLMLLGENVYNARVQLRAAFIKYNVPENLWDDVVVYPVCNPIMRAQKEVVREVIDRELGHFEVVIVDTSAAYFGGDDDNSNTDQRAHAASMRALVCKELGFPTVIVNCHPTKSATRDNLLPRGGGAFLAEIDSNVTLWNDHELLTISYTKLRGPPFEPIIMQMSSQTVGFHGGEFMEVPVAMGMTEEELARARMAYMSQEDLLVNAIRELPDGTISDWATACAWVTPTGEPNRMQLNRVMKRLLSEGRVKKMGSKGYQLAKR